MITTGNADQSRQQQGKLIRCFAKAEEEFNTCYFDEENGCPEGCGRICEPDFSAGMDLCNQLVDEGILVGDIPLAICINKFAVTDTLEISSFQKLLARNADMR